MQTKLIDRPDPRGHYRNIIKATRSASANTYYLDCGHTSEGVTHFHLDKVGMERRCFKCGRNDIALFNKENQNA